MAVPADGMVLHLTGYGSVRVFRFFAKDGVAEYWATNDLAMEPGVRRHHAEVSFAIENYHRELKQFCGVEKCQVRSERAQRNHIGMALRAFLRLEWHFFTTGISAFEAKLRLVREAVRSYLARPAFPLPAMANCVTPRNIEESSPGIRPIPCRVNPNIRFNPHSRQSR